MKKIRCEGASNDDLACPSHRIAAATNEIYALVRLMPIRGTGWICPAGVRGEARYTDDGEQKQPTS